MTETAKMYGGSLYDLAAEEGRQDLILEQLTQVRQLLSQEEEYIRLLSTPSIPKKERCALLDEAFGSQVDPYLLNFLKILCQNGTLGEFGGCVREYRNRYNADNGILEATAYTALALDERQTEALRAKLADVTGKTIQLTNKVDPSVLGGIRLMMDGTQLDGTVQNRLAAIRKNLANIVL